MLPQSFEYRFRAAAITLLSMKLEHRFFAFGDDPRRACLSRVALEAALCGDGNRQCLARALQRSVVDPFEVTQQRKDGSYVGSEGLFGEET